MRKEAISKRFWGNWYKGWVDPGALLNDALLLVSNFLGEFWGPTMGVATMQVPNDLGHRNSSKS